MLAKVLDLRVFPDDASKCNLSLRDTRGGLLVVSQFTLYAETRRGRRPSFSNAAPPEVAHPLYDRLTSELSRACPGPFGQGIFGAEMLLDFVNWGPVTLLLDSSDYV
jgi:D-aminoacyl-tRNA deacylase